jgi:hypothetical protein
LFFAELFRRWFGGSAASVLYAIAGLAVVAALGVGAHAAYANGATAQDLVWEKKLAATNDHWNEVVRRTNQAGMQAANRERLHHITRLDEHKQRAIDLEKIIASDQVQVAALATQLDTVTAKAHRLVRRLRPAPGALCYSRAAIKVLNQ